MKIGFFTETYLPQTNGVVHSLNAFGEELVKRGHEVHIFAPKTDVKEYKGMTIHSVPGITFKPYPDYKIAIPIKLKIPKLDIVHTHGPFSMGLLGYMVSKRQRIPRITTYHTLISEYVAYVSKYGTKITSKIAKNYCEHNYRRYNHIITPSNFVKNTLSKKLQKKTTVIPTPIDNRILTPVKNAKQKLHLEKYNRIYFHLGRISKEKKVDVLIEAAADFVKENEILLIAGKGPTLEELKEQARKLKLGKKVKFLGFIPEEMKATYYSAADLFIMPSTSETEGNVVIESQACGTPVIAADATSLPELITEGKDGYFFTPGNSKELARVINYHKFPKEMSKNARIKSEEFTVKKSVDKVEKIYKKLVK